MSKLPQSPSACDAVSPTAGFGSDLPGSGFALELFSRFGQLGFFFVIDDWEMQIE